MTLSIFVPDVYLTWLLRWSVRGLATSAAIGVLAGAVSLVFRALALMIDTLTGVFQSCMVLGSTLVQIYEALGLFGQVPLLCAMCAGLLMFIYRGGLFLYHEFQQRGGRS